VGPPTAVSPSWMCSKLSKCWMRPAAAGFRRTGGCTWARATSFASRSAAAGPGPGRGGTGRNGAGTLLCDVPQSPEDTRFGPPPRRERHQVAFLPTHFPARARVQRCAPCRGRWGPPGRRRWGRPASDREFPACGGPGQQPGAWRPAAGAEVHTGGRGGGDDAERRGRPWLVRWDSIVGSPAQAPQDRLEEDPSPVRRRRILVAQRGQGAVRLDHGRHHALPLSGVSHPHSLADHGMRTTTISPRGLWRAGYSATSYARFGKRLRGNQPVERPKPRPGPTSPRGVSSHHVDHSDN
jgi:hypothetical protein